MAFNSETMYLHLVREFSDEGPDHVSGIFTDLKLAQKAVLELIDGREYTVTHNTIGDIYRTKDYSINLYIDSTAVPLNELF